MLNSDVAPDDRRLHAARLRQSMREIDAQMEQIRADDRLFHRCGFGSDVHEIQLTALRAARKDIAIELDHLRETAPARPRRSRFVSWLLIPPALGAILLETLRPTRRRSARRARVAVVRDPEI